MDKGTMIHRLRALRMRIELELKAEGDSPVLLPEMTAMLVDVCVELGLSLSQARWVVGERAWRAVDDDGVAEGGLRVLVDRRVGLSIGCFSVN